MPVLAIDLLWLLVGIVPGVICLIVDFTTGCIYLGERREAGGLPDGAPLQPVRATVWLDGVAVAQGNVEPDLRTRLSWRETVDPAALNARGRISFERADGIQAEAALADLLVPKPGSNGRRN